MAFELEEAEVARAPDIIGEEVVAVCGVRMVGVEDADEVEVLKGSALPSISP
jgi:hypothetical protein